MWSIMINSNKNNYIFICFSNGAGTKNYSLLKSQRTIKRIGDCQLSNIQKSVKIDRPRKAEIELLYQKYAAMILSMILFIYNKISI